MDQGSDTTERSFRDVLHGMWPVKSLRELKQEVKVHTYGKMWFQNGVPVKTKEVRLLINTAPHAPPTPL